MKRFKLALEWFLNPDHLPFLIIKQLGWDKESGFRLELIEPKEHVDASELLQQGKVDAAITEPIHLLADLDKGKKQIGFARFLHTDGGVLYFKESGIKRPRDMQNLRVQYPGAPGKGGKAIVATMIEADGGNYDPDKLTPINKGFMHTDALIENEADVATLAFYNFEVIEARHRGYDADFFSLKNWGVPDFCQLILIAEPARLEKDNEIFAAFVSLLKRAIDFVKQNPDKAQAIYKKETKSEDGNELAEKIYNATLPCFTYDFDLSPRYYQNLNAWMKRVELIDKTHQEAWTNRFL